MFVRCCKCEAQFEVETLDDEYPTICPNCDEVDQGLEIIDEMQSFWAFKRRDDSWDLIEEEKFDELPDVVAGSLRIIDAENRTKALEQVAGTEETIRRIFNDVNRIGNEKAYHKWFGGEEDAKRKSLPRRNILERFNVRRFQSEIMVKWQG